MDGNLIIWDWNGTLLNDVDSAVNALNHMLGIRGIAPTTRAYYREHFGFPVRPFYAELGVDLAHEDWDRICIDFHRFIDNEPKVLRLDTKSALRLAHEAGLRQVILSALREDLLRRDVAAAGIADIFDAIYGVDNLDGASKLSRGRDLVRDLRLHDTALELFFIGDTLHDMEVAQELGTRCILVDGGHQSAERLATSGAPVAPSLIAAVQMVLDATHSASTSS